jgi:hypothetical protein
MNYEVISWTQTGEEKELLSEMIFEDWPLTELCRRESFFIRKMLKEARPLGGVKHTYYVTEPVTFITHWQA